MIFNVTGSGSGTSASLTVTAPAGATVTVSKDGKTKTKATVTGTAVFKGLSTGIWTVTASKDSDSASKTVEIKADYETQIGFFTATIHVVYPAGLAYLGYDPGGIDGVNGQKTRQAIRQFQGAEGLSVDGVAGEQTAIRLKDAVWQDRFAKDNIVPSSGQPPDLPGWWGKYKWFTPSEFRCPCGKCGGGIEKMHEGIVAEANDMREYLGVPIVIVPPDGHSGGSGYRCQAYNDSLPGSVRNSRHVQGKAVDIITRGVPDEKVEERLSQRKAAGKLRYWYRISPGAHHMDIE